MLKKKAYLKKQIRHWNKSLVKNVDEIGVRDDQIQFFNAECFRLAK